MRFLTFDLGTTLFKVALLDETGRLLDVERIPPPVRQPRADLQELEADEFTESLAGAAAHLRKRAGGFDDVAAVSFASQANSFAFLDAAGAPIVPFILWNDRRAEPLARELAAIASRPDFRATTGMPRFSPSLALAKVLWLRRESPDLLGSARRFCFLSDYLTARLCGKLVTEAGVAGLSGALDIRTLQWRGDILDSVQMRAITMPPAIRAGSDLGPVSLAGSETFGLPRDCRIILGCLDQYAGAIGTGTVAPNQICETTGTVLAAVRCADRLDADPAPGVFQGPGYAADRFFRMSFSSTSANLLEHYRNSLQDRPTFEQLAHEASLAADDVLIKPYREGESIESCFAHVQKHHLRGQVVHGIMRCVAQTLKQQIQSLSPDRPPSEIRSAGGGAKSNFWLQMKADLIGIPFVSLECEEPTSLGAAILAAHGIGMGSVEEIAAKWVRIRKTFLPIAQAAAQ